MIFSHLYPIIVFEFLKFIIYSPIFVQNVNHELGKFDYSKWARGTVREGLKYLALERQSTAYAVDFVWTEVLLIWRSDRIFE